MESYKDYPMSLAEHKANDDLDAAKWAPRDVLIDMLRKIDSGEMPDIDTLVVAYHFGSKGTGNDDGGTIGYRQAGTNKYTSIGVLVGVQAMLTTWEEE